MTPAQAAKLVTVALAGYPTPASFLGPDAVEDMTAAWSMVLADLDYAEAQAALVRYMALDPDRLPGPGHIRRIVDEAKHGRRRIGEDAWGDIGKLNRAGYSNYNHAPATAWADQRARWAFYRLGDWRAWSELEIGAPLASFRARFIALYDSAATADAEERSLATLPGVARIALPGEAKPIAVLVGDVTTRALAAGGGR